MNSFELNKIAGAALAAALVVFGGRTLADLAWHEPTAAKAGWELPKPTGGAAGGGAPAAPATFSFAALAEGLKKAGPSNVEAGQDVFRRCAACHTVTKGGASAQGPNLWNVINRAKASYPNFNFSDAMKAKGGNWTYENFAAYIWDPRGFVPGNRMAFAGIRDNQELIDLMAYMRTIGDSPAPLPQ